MSVLRADPLVGEARVVQPVGVGDARRRGGQRLPDLRRPADRRRARRRRVQLWRRSDGIGRRARQALLVAGVVGEADPDLQPRALIGRHRRVGRAGRPINVGARADPLVGKTRVVQPVGVGDARRRGGQRRPDLRRPADRRRARRRRVSLRRAGDRRRRRVGELPPVPAPGADRPGDRALAPARQRDRHVFVRVGLDRDPPQVVAPLHSARRGHLAPVHRERIVAHRPEADPDLLAERHPEVERVLPVMRLRQALEARRQRRPGLGTRAGHDVRRHHRQGSAVRCADRALRLAILRRGQSDRQILAAVRRDRDLPHAALPVDAGRAGHRAARHRQGRACAWPRA